LFIFINKSLFFFSRQLIYKNEQILEKEIDDLSAEVKKILIKARDEAHRFANYYRKQQMKKKLELD